MRLTLRSEHLAPLSDDDLRLAAAGAREWTGNIRCVVSVQQHCVTNFCTLLCVETTAS